MCRLRKCREIWVSLFQRSIGGRPHPNALSIRFFRYVTPPACDKDKKVAREYFIPENPQLASNSCECVVGASTSDGRRCSRICSARSRGFGNGPRADWPLLLVLLHLDSP